MLSASTRALLLGALISTGALASGEAKAAPPAYTLFESGQVRPLALSPDRKTLFAVNTPDGRLEIYDFKNGAITYRESVPVGVEPVAIAVRSNNEVWVVNHLSDSVSIVDVQGLGASRVTKTLLVGDEPRDIVFAGTNKSRAFITTAHRGQNNPNDPQLTTPGVGRADVWVFDANNQSLSLGGTPLTIVTLFSDTPRALAASPDGKKVYVAAHFSGNKTMALDSGLVPDGPEAEGGTPAPNESHAGIPGPANALIVKFNGQHWVDEINRIWDEKIRLSLPDKDVFVIDAIAAVPKQVAGADGFYSGVGTILYNMVVNPVSKKIYVSNTEARNEVRFSGPGIFAGSTLQGHLVENRITVIDPNGRSVTPHHLNPHIDYDNIVAAVPNEENELSLALPQGMAISSDGSVLYVAATSSDKIGVYGTQALENDAFWPDPDDQIVVSGGGPTGVLLDDASKRLFVMTRFDNGISVINTQSGDELQHVGMFNPEPPSVTNGRRFLYDARLTSGHGDSSCASCHVNGDMDHLAWDLGNPDGELALAPGPFLVTFLPEEPINFHPIKGPMVTQSLRGLANHGPMHWRGDRNGGSDSHQPDSGIYDENAAFNQFNEAFTSLMGRSTPLPAADMQAFTDFALQLTYPPNPIRDLDNQLTADQEIGRDLFFSKPATVGMTCQFCHVIDPDANAEFGVDRPGFFGSDGVYIGTELPQTLKVPQLRNAYQKVGMFGLPADPVINPEGDDAHLGDQIRGFGFTHEGGMDTIFHFISQMGFVEDPILSPEGFPVTPAGETQRRQVESFVFAFDSNMKPIVGQQITLRLDNQLIAAPRIKLLKERAEAGECDLVVQGNFFGQPHGYLYENDKFTRDRQNKPPITDLVLRALALFPGQEMTYTCVPPGSGVRVALDRDLDGTLNGDE